MKKLSKIVLGLVRVLILLFTLIIPFKRSLVCGTVYNCESQSDDIARYAAGGQVFGALATFFYLSLCSLG